MLRRPGVRTLVRCSSSVLLGLHLLVVAWVPHVDARIDAASRRQQSHIEAPSRQACAPSHNHLYCQLCRAFTITGATSGGYRLELPSESQPLQPASGPTVAGVRPERSPTQPRAPPLV